MSNCNYCNPDSGECEYWQDSLDGQFYQEVVTYEWDDWNDDYVTIKNYGVCYCQYCGRKLISFGNN